MKESTLAVSTRDGAMAARTFHPDPAEALPVVIFYMDAFGLRDALFGMARRIATNGYFVAMPDLFHRSAPVAPFDVATAFSTPPERERLMALIRGLTAEGVAADTEALLAHLASDRAADTNAVCAVGYCMGGGYALRAAGSLADRVVAAASYHGGHLATEAPDSPHVVAARAKGRLYVGYAEDDHSFPDGQRAALDAALTAAGVRHTIERYHARHGFAVPDHPVYDEAAAARHWDTLLALFAEATGTRSTAR